MSIIWIPKNASHDYEAASAFGTRRFIFEDTQDMFNPDRLLERARLVLAKSAAEDFLMLAGPQIMNIVAYQVLLEKHGQVRLLMFHARDNGYRERLIHVS